MPIKTSVALLARGPPLACTSLGSNVALTFVEVYHKGNVFESFVKTLQYSQSLII